MKLIKLILTGLFLIPGGVGVSYSQKLCLSPKNVAPASRWLSGWPLAACLPMIKSSLSKMRAGRTSRQLARGRRYVFLSSLNTSSQDKAVAAVDEFISKQAQENKVKEYKDVRAIVRGDIDSDGREDLVVLYTLYEFKTWPGERKYLAIFINNGKIFQYRDNISLGTADKLFALKPIESGKILIETKEYINGNGIYITKVGKMNYIFMDGKLKRTKDF